MKKYDRVPHCLTVVKTQNHSARVSQRWPHRDWRGLGTDFLNCSLSQLTPNSSSPVFIFDSSFFSFLFFTSLVLFVFSFLCEASGLAPSKTFFLFKVDSSGWRCRSAQPKVFSSMDKTSPSTCFNYIARRRIPQKEQRTSDSRIRFVELVRIRIREKRLI